MSDLVAEAYRTKRLEGLGDVLVCRLCDTIFVSANDALRHLQLYHKILSAVRLRQVLEESASGERRCSSSGESNTIFRGSVNLSEVTRKIPYRFFCRKTIEEYLKTKS